MTETNVELARPGFRAEDDLDALREFLAPDAKWHGGDPSAAGACQNRGQALEFMPDAPNRRRLPEPIDAGRAGDKVVMIDHPACLENRRTGGAERQSHNVP